MVIMDRHPVHRYIHESIKELDFKRFSKILNGQLVSIEGDISSILEVIKAVDKQDIVLLKKAINDGGKVTHWSQMWSAGRGDKDILFYLLTIQKNNNVQKLLCMMLEHDNIDLFLFFIERQGVTTIIPRIYNMLAKKGRLDIIEILMKKKLYLGSHIGFDGDCNIYRCAVMKGYIHILDWWSRTEHFDRFDGGACSLIAARHGQVCVLDWLVKHNYAIDRNLLCYNAIVGNHKMILLWCMLHNIYPSRADLKAVDNDVMKHFLLRNGCRYDHFPPSYVRKPEFDQYKPKDGILSYLQMIF